MSKANENMHPIGNLFLGASLAACAMAYPCGSNMVFIFHGDAAGDYVGL